MSKGKLQINAFLIELCLNRKVRLVPGRQYDINNHSWSQNATKPPPWTPGPAFYRPHAIAKFIHLHYSWPLINKQEVFIYL